MDGGTGVPLDALVDRQLDTALNASTVNTTNVHLKANDGNTQGGAPGGSNLCTSVELENGDRIICQHATLTASTWYTFTITTDVEDGATNSLAAAATYAFQTSNFGGGGEYIASPTIASSVPSPGGTLPINAKIRVYFNPGGSGTGTSMKTGGNGSIMSVENVLVLASSQRTPTGDNLLACASTGSDVAAPDDCNYAWNASNNELIITPGKKAPAGTEDSTGGSTLTAGADYVLHIEGPSGGHWQSADGIRNTQDMPMMDEDYWAYFQASAADTTGPDVQATYPQNNETGVDRAVYDFYVGFNEALDPATVSGGSVQLWCEDDDGNYANGCRTGGSAGFDSNDSQMGVYVSYDSAERSATLSPSALLSGSTVHYIRIRDDINDIVGNRFDADSGTAGNQVETITFTTGTNVNGAASDSTKPLLQYVNADNFSVAATFSEPLQFSINDNTNGRPSHRAWDVNNLDNWTIESPPGNPANLQGKSISYDPGNLTVTISGFTLPPDQIVRVKAQTATGVINIKDLSGNAVSNTGSGHVKDATTQSVRDSGGRLGPGAHHGEFDFHSFGMEPIMVMPRTALAGSTTKYEVEFPADIAIPLGGNNSSYFPTGIQICS